MKYIIEDLFAAPRCLFTKDMSHLFRRFKELEQDTGISGGNDESRGGRFNSKKRKILNIEKVLYFGLAFMTIRNISKKLLKIVHYSIFTLSSLVSWWRTVFRFQSLLEYLFILAHSLLSSLILLHSRSY